MLFVDGGNNRVGIGTGTPASSLEVTGTFAVRSSSSSTFNDTNNAENVRMLVSGTHFNADGIDKDFQVSSDTNTHALFVDAGNNRVGINASAPEATLDVKTDLAITEAAVANATSSLSFYSRFSDGQRGFVILKAESLASGSSDLVINARNAFTDAERLRIASTGDVTFTGNLVVPNQIIHAGDTDTYMQFHAANEWRVVAGGYERFAIGTDVVVNEDSHDADFRVESDANTHMLFVDGGNNNVLLGKASLNIGVAGVEFRGASSNYFTTSGDTVLGLNRLSSDGTVLEIRKDSTIVGSIGTQGGDLNIGTGACGIAFVDGVPAIYPWTTTGNTTSDAAIDLGDSGGRFKDLYLSGCAKVPKIGATDVGLYFNGSYNAVVPYRPDTDAAVDDYLDLGMYSHRWDDIFATNGTIQTSDRNEKQDIEFLTEAEERVAVAAKGLLKKFRWKSSVAEKGDDARVHFGIIAQDLQDAFEAEGLDAGRYGMFTSDTWINEDGEEQTRMGVRYSELLAFIISAI